MRVKSIPLILLTVMIFGCGVSPSPIDYGKDNCDFCKMTIMDKRFAAALVTSRGKTFKFDSVECLAEFHESERIKRDNIKMLLVDQFDSPGTMINAAGAFYLRSPNLRSPMGFNAAAFSVKSAAENARADYAGDVISWEQVLHLAPAR